MNKCFLDTNILVYAKDQSSIYHTWSLDIIEGPMECVTSSKNLLEYFAVVTKGHEPMLAPVEAETDLNEFMDSFEILFPNGSSFQICLDLAGNHQPKGLLIHDFEIAAIAIANGISKLATVNAGDFKVIEELDLICP